MKTATFVALTKRTSKPPLGELGVSAVYKLSEPLAFEKYNDITGDYDRCTTSYVWLSTSSVFGAETHAFPCDESGSVLDWSELSGSMKGEHHHAEVLEEMGYVHV